MNDQTGLYNTGPASASTNTTNPPSSPGARPEPDDAELLTLLANEMDETGDFPDDLSGERRKRIAFAIRRAGAALRAVPAGEPVAWCPRDKNGHLYVEHASESVELVEEDIAAQNDASSKFAPFTVVPLYTHPPRAASQSGSDR